MKPHPTPTRHPAHYAATDVQWAYMKVLSACLTRMHILRQKRRDSPKAERAYQEQKQVWLAACRSVGLGAQNAKRHVAHWGACTARAHGVQSDSRGGTAAPTTGDER